MAGTDAITIYKGEDVDLNFTMSPVENITGWTIIFTGKTKAGDELEVTAAVVSGPAGTFRVSLTDTDSETLGEGRHSYDVWRTDSGSERLIAIGKFTILLPVRDTVP